MTHDQSLLCAVLRPRHLPGNPLETGDLEQPPPNAEVKLVAPPLPPAVSTAGYVLKAS